MFKLLRNRVVFLSMSKFFYAVATGRNPGIYNTWGECETQVKGFSGAKFKKFGILAEAEKFIKIHSNSNGNIQTNQSCVGVKKFTTTKRLRSDEDINSAVPFSKVKKVRQSNDNRSTLKNSVLSSNTKKPQRKTICIPLPDSSANPGEFNVNSEGYVEVYTDGACGNNGRNNPKAGIGVWFGANHPCNVSRPVVGRPTNNVAEIQAVEVALTICKNAGKMKVCVYTDSKFLITSVLQWMKKWKRNDWKTSTGTDVKNKDDFIKLLKAMTGMDIKWEHVRGHAGLLGNEMADKLAREGAEKYVSFDNE